MAKSGWFLTRVIRMIVGQCLGRVYKEHRGSIVLLVKDVPDSESRKRLIHRLYITTNEKTRYFDTSRRFQLFG